MNVELVTGETITIPPSVFSEWGEDFIRFTINKTGELHYVRKDMMVRMWTE